MEGWDSSKFASKSERREIGMPGPYIGDRANTLVVLSQESSFQKSLKKQFNNKEPPLVYNISLSNRH